MALRGLRYFHVSLIDEAAVIEKILTHLGLWPAHALSSPRCAMLRLFGGPGLRRARASTGSTRPKANLPSGSGELEIPPARRIAGRVVWV